MKLQTNHLLESLSFEEVKNLTSEVKETLLTNLTIEKSKNFTAAELWNVHRQRKNVLSRRFYGY